MKKMISILLSMMLIFTGVSPVFASSDDSAAVEKAIKYVKSIFSVSEDMTEFSYDSWHDDEFNTTMIYLNWNDEEYKKSLSVSIDTNNNIYNFDAYDENSYDNTGLGKVSKADAQKIAENLLNNLCPAWKGTYEYDSSNTYGQTYAFNFKLKMNDVNVYNSNISLGINKFTGEPTNFYGYDIQRGCRYSFDSNQGTLGTDAAKEAYMDNIGINLKYYTNFDWNDRELKIFPAYAPNGTTRFIDAKTGKPVTEYESYYYNGKMAAGEEDAYESQTTLSDIEKAEIDKTVALLSKEEATKKAVAQAPASLGSSTPDYSRLYKDDIDGKYYWSLNFEDGSVSLDAQSGELRSYCSYIYTDSDRKVITVEKAKAMAEKFVQQVAPDKYKETVYEENPFNEYNFAFSRVVNGVVCDGNYQVVTVDYTNGKINNYNCIWYDVEFPEIKDVKTSDAAFEAYADYSGFDLSYIRFDEKTEKLAYSLGEDAGYMLNPYTFEKIDYLGDEYSDTADVKYQDIEGKWYEDTVTKLVDNGYYIEGENFNGNNLITQEQFLRFLYSPEQNYYDDTDEFYDIMIGYDIIKKNEKAPESQLTRQGAAKLLVRFIGQEKSAAHSEIFKNMYTDKVNEAYRGYAAVAYALKIMQGDAKGRFNGTSYMTNAQAATAIYNTLELI